MAESSDQVTTVRIFNQSYKIRSGGDTAYVQQLAEYVDRKMTEVARSTPTVDTGRVAILAALGIADDYFKAKDGLEKTDSTINERVGRALSLLESALGAEPS